MRDRHGLYLSACRSLGHGRALRGVCVRWWMARCSGAHENPLPALVTAEELDFARVVALVLPSRDRCGNTLLLSPSSPGARLKAQYCGWAEALQEALPGSRSGKKGLRLGGAQGPGAGVQTPTLSLQIRVIRAPGPRHISPLRRPPDHGAVRSPSSCTSARVMVVRALRSLMSSVQNQAPEGVKTTGSETTHVPAALTGSCKLVPCGTTRLPGPWRVIQSASVPTPR